MSMHKYLFIVTTRTTMPQQHARQFRSIMFTWHRPDTTSLAIRTSRNDGDAEEDRIISFYVYQWERCPTTNSLHAQGYIEFTQRMRLKQILKDIFGLREQNGRFHDGPHVEGRYVLGNRQSCIEYCTKEETREPNTEPIIWGERGDPAHQGRRTDLDEAVLDIDNGISQRDFRRKHISIAAKYPIFVKQIYADAQRSRENQVTEVIVFYGPPGVGKTRLVHHQVARSFGSLTENLYTVELTNPVWFDGYEGQAVMLFDDFSSGWLKDTCIAPRYFLRLLDRYEVRVNLKGHYAYRRCDRIYITSNQSPEMWSTHVNEEGYKEALMRRLTRIYRVTSTHAIEEINPYLTTPPVLPTVDGLQEFINLGDTIEY